jgi:hypothetical protein
MPNDQVGSYTQQAAKAPFKALPNEIGRTAA